MKNFKKYLPIVFGLLILGMTSSCDPIIEPPQESITLEQANVLEDEFIETRYQIINDALDIEDTRDFWFSIETLKQYIAYVEQEGSAQGLDNLGIRIYFAAYPQQGDYPDPGYSTVVLVPTAEQASRDRQTKGFLPFQEGQEIIEGVNVLNYAGGGRPPNDIE